MEDNDLFKVICQRRYDSKYDTIVQKKEYNYKSIIERIRYCKVCNNGQYQVTVHSPYVHWHRDNQKLLNQKLDPPTYNCHGVTARECATYKYKVKNNIVNSVRCCIRQLSVSAEFYDYYGNRKNRFQCSLEQYTYKLQSLTCRKIMKDKTE